MARGRMLLKSISLSEQVNSLSCDSAQLLFSWLIAQLDQNGCFYGDPGLIKSLVFPRKHHSVQQIRAWLNEMERAKDRNGESLIVRYKVGRATFLFFPGFKRSQIGCRFDREPATNIPPPPFRQTDGRMTAKWWQSGDNNDGKMTESIPPKRREENRRERTPLPPTPGNGVVINPGFGDEDFQMVRKAYERDFGLLVPLLGEEIKIALGRWPVEWIIEAMSIAVMKNVRKWSYVKAVLERWESDGRGTKTGEEQEPPLKRLTDYD